MYTEYRHRETEKREHQDRLARLQKLMDRDGVDMFVVTQNVDQFYLSGTMQTGYIVVPRIGHPIYYVKRSVTRAEAESTITVKPLGSFRDFGKTVQDDFSTLFEHETPLTAVTEYDVLPVQMFERLRHVMPTMTWKDGSTMFRELRMIKSPFEVSRIRIAAAAVHRVLEQAAEYVQEGMTELELVAHIEHMFRMQGHAGIMRMRGYNQEIITGMVAAGDAAAEPTYFDGPAGGRGLSPASPQGASRRVIGVNEPLLVDIGCCIDGYVIDQTRTLVIGELESDLQAAYDAAEHIIRATEAKLKPGTVCEELYIDSLAMAAQYGLSDHFMGYGVDQVKFLGHGIGIEIDEWPVLAKGFKQQLEPGMVIAIEPKFTFPGRGVVGIENTYLITETGFVKLTTAPEGVIHC